MSDEGEKTCPLCAEEMDLTDQQLKPCKCGYEICVWCWHHIMDMAEKDETEGRCPACRTPYNKEKIVGTAASCERLVSEMNVEKKIKPQKGKSKSSEGRQQLASVRVIQRNLVYVVGLPLNFADEDLLQHREYFGQYGKVLKVSISRTAGGAIQHFANSTCSVYITFSNEEDAVRCIQSVHGFILDSRPLRACFGTTKYCHAWLRNVPCSNPDCLYLHEIGSQEDSFTKDEIISAYTRSRVQQITGSSYSTQRRSGNVLPPPVDDYINNSSASSGKPTTKTAVNTNNSVSSASISPPKSNSGSRSAALPAGASWGTRASSNQPLPTSTPYSNGPLKQKPDICNGPSHLSSLHSYNGKTAVPAEESISSQDKNKTESLEPVKKESNTDGRVTISESLSSSVHSATSPVYRKPDGPSLMKSPSGSSNVVDTSLKSSGLASGKYSIDGTDRSMENICSDILSMGIRENQILENGYVQHNREAVTSQSSGTASNIIDDVGSTGIGSIEDDLLSFENQRFKDPEVATNRTSDFFHASHLSKHSNVQSPQYSNADGSVAVDLNGQFGDRNSNLMVSTSNFPIGHPENIFTSSVEYANLIPTKPIGRYEGKVAGGGVDMGESSIISNILSIDFDPWGESLTSPQNLAKLLGETDRRQGSFGAPGSRKTQNGNQSRFSFAREEEPMNQFSNFGQSIDPFEKGIKQHHPFGNDFSNSNSLHFDRFVGRNGFPSLNGMESETLSGSHSYISSDRFPVSRSQIPAPPGFSMPSRLPPPGFTSHEGIDTISDRFSGNNMLDTSPLLRNNYPASSGGNNTISDGDIEFNDPAILAVGKGTLPSGINSSGVDFIRIKDLAISGTVFLNSAMLIDFLRKH
ncbi:ccr4-not transcription complex subunit 4 [Phtheirospermum japonicum]|uniref:Ccr4-not transcription complex subunit 4 n=1 Tax=Phtheirospermum japonicum TaxID=374723 RepID=A0A830CBL5_9LAMI|nr:ccr4-not transcription complex subunit 4 [Phtheirospermum japonicum]